MLARPGRTFPGRNSRYEIRIASGSVTLIPKRHDLLSQSFLQFVQL